MEELKKVLASLLSEKLYQIIISNPRQKAGAFKIKVRPVMVKEQVVFQQTVYEGTKVFHDNLDRQIRSQDIWSRILGSWRVRARSLRSLPLSAKRGRSR